MKPRISFILIISSLACTAVFAQDKAVKSVKTNATVVTVNGQAISQKDYDDYLDARQKRNTDNRLPSDKDTIIDELVRRAVVLQDAQNLKLETTPEFMDKLEKARQNLLMEYAIRHYLDNNPVTDAQVKTEYDERIKKITLPLQYKAKHILTTEERAKELVAKLDKGEDFAKLAKEHSSDKASSTKGGDLGWFDLQQMVPEFGQAVKEIEKGHYNKAPVKTQFGWHIILVEDTRTAPPPSFDSVKDNLKQNIEGMRMMQYMEDLVKKAKVQK
jgi:peptidyl-prolyl cis-trans isomerase C